MDYPDELTPTETETFILPRSRMKVEIAKATPSLERWNENIRPVVKNYNNKPVLNLNNEPNFPEFAILRYFQNAGWEGVWVDKSKFRTGYDYFGEDNAGKYLASLTSERLALLDEIYDVTGEKNSGCWDIFCWKGDDVLFAESKYRDAIKPSQIKWLEAALDVGLSLDSLLLVQWQVQNQVRSMPSPSNLAKPEHTQVPILIDQAIDGGNSMSRAGTAERRTGETFVKVSIEIDGSGKAEVKTGVGFLDHILHLLAHHSGMDLTVEAEGDTWVDDHHTVEDTGLVLGRAFGEALGDRSNLVRFSDASAPLIEAMSTAVIDLGGRSHLTLNLGEMPEKIGTFDVELFHEFLRAFTQYGHFTLHLNCHYGINAHHKVESGVKAMAVAFREGVSLRTGGSASTKGVID